MQDAVCGFSALIPPLSLRASQWGGRERHIDHNGLRPICVEQCREEFSLCFARPGQQGLSSFQGPRCLPRGQLSRNMSEVVYCSLQNAKQPRFLPMPMMIRLSVAQVPRGRVQVPAAPLARRAGIRLSVGNGSDRSTRLTRRSGSNILTCP